MKLQYSSIISFLTASLLKVNDSKTHTMLLTTSQLRRQRNLNLTVKIGSVTQQSSPVERLLGLQLHQNLKFREYIQDNKKSLIKSLNARLKALQKIKKRVTSFSQRLAIANGIFNSKGCLPHKCVERLVGIPSGQSPDNHKQGHEGDL